jgi:hypothetical protein
MTQSKARTGSSGRRSSQGCSSSHPHASIPTSRRRPPLPRRTRSEPRRRSRSPSVRVSASWIRSPASPQDHDQGAEAAAVRMIAGGAHDGDDLLHLGRIGRLPQSPVARRTSGVESRHRRWRATPAGAVEQQFGLTPPRARGTNPTIRASRCAADQLAWRAPRYRFPHGAAPKAGSRALSRVPQSRRVRSRASFVRPSRRGSRGLSRRPMAGAIAPLRRGRAVSKSAQLASSKPW